MAMTQERRAELQAARDKAAQPLRSARAGMHGVMEEYAASTDASNSVKARLADDVWDERFKRGINPDGTKMSMDDRVSHYNRLERKHTKAIVDYLFDKAEANRQAQPTIGEQVDAAVERGTLAP